MQGCMCVAMALDFTTSVSIYSDQAVTPTVVMEIAQMQKGKGIGNTRAHTHTRTHTHKHIIHTQTHHNTHKHIHTQTHTHTSTSHTHTHTHTQFDLSNYPCVFPAGPHNNKLHKESPTTADSIQHPMLQYDSGINTDASGHSSISPKDLHNASSSDVFDCNSTSVTNIREPTASSNTGRPYLMSFNPPSPKTRKANSTFNPLTTEFDPLHGLPRASGSPMQNGSQADSIRTVASTPKLLQSPSLVRGKTRSEHRVSSSGLPNLELQTESPSIARPRPRPRGSSQVDTILFRSPDGPFVPRSPTFVTRSPTGSIQSLTTYPTFEDTSIPCPSDDGSSVSSFGLANQSTSDMEGDYHPDLYPVAMEGTFRWSLDAGIPM